jgi:hypothetical protein
LYELTDKTDRLHTFKIILNDVQFYHGCKAKLFPKGPRRFDLKKTTLCRELGTFAHLRGDKETGELAFVKTYERFSNYPVEKPETLKVLFDHLAKSKIRHTYRNFSYFSLNNDSLILESKYCQQNSLAFIKNKSDAKKMLIHVIFSFILD